MTEKKPLKVTFAPGCFDQFDGTQEELNELMAKIQEMADSGELAENAISLEDALDEFTDEELEEMFELVPTEYNKPKTLH